ncbi:helix-turn-helix transcriptional regulator [Serratia marcescens]|nr:helix-turn-helix transcriptional regulator [Serratia marcescens]MBH2767654.1 helix-turn-helix transcriptional regulator [Serratia marcescens]MBH3264944.1 helix-turn-helix transcriptional regulator [Serratia marcescens]
MDMKENRRERLKAWFSEKTIPAKEKSYLSQLMTGKASFGEKAARRLEQSYGMPSGFLDGTNDEQIAEQESPHFKIEVLDVQASAGPGVINSEVVQTIRSIEYTDDHAVQMFGGKQASQIKMITVDGDSMAGTIELGDAIFVDVSKDYFSGDGIYVFLYKNHLHVKRLQMLPDHLLVHSDNPEYIDWVITEENEHKLKVIGRVLLSQSQAFKRHG